MTKDINENISGSSSKYEIIAKFVVKGSVEVQDIVGALFGQTEGLLDNLELRELQKSGRVGRIVVTTRPDNGLTVGEVIIPSSLDKTETAILAATLETVERVGPCEATFELQEIRDLREYKLKQIEQRAKELLKEWKGLKDEKNLTEKIQEELVKDSIIKWNGLDAGPEIETADEVIIVEGRNDIQELLKYGIKNTVAVNGTSIPKPIIELTKRKPCIAFLDGDRGGKMILNELIQVSDIKYYTFAPENKEVEELTRKELFAALQNRKPIEEYKKQRERELKQKNSWNRDHGRAAASGASASARAPRKAVQKNHRSITEPAKGRGPIKRSQTPPRSNVRSERAPQGPRKQNYQERDQIPRKYTKWVKNLVSSNEAVGLDSRGNEVLHDSNVEFIKHLNGNVHTLIIDGVVNQRLLDILEDKNIQTIIAVNFSSDLRFKNPQKIKLYYFSDFI